MSVVWWFYNPGSVLLFGGLGVLVYLIITLESELLHRVKSPFYFGLAFPVLGFFDVGLLAFFSVLLYSGGVYLVEIVKNRVKIREG